MFIKFLITSLLLALSLFASCKPGDIPFTQSESDDEINKSFVGIGVVQKYWRPKFTQTTPQGAKVRSTVQIPLQALQAIDEGIGNQIRAYDEQNPEWTAYRQISDYDVMVISPMCTNEDGSPCMYVMGYQSAGTMLGGSELWDAIDARPVVVIVHQQDQQWRYIDYFRNSADYESEHAREWVNRRNNPTGIFYYWAHEGDVHPHARRAASLLSPSYACRVVAQ